MFSVFKVCFTKESSLVKSRLVLRLLLIDCFIGALFFSLYSPAMTILKGSYLSYTYITLLLLISYADGFLTPALKNTFKFSTLLILQPVFFTLLILTLVSYLLNINNEVVTITLISLITVILLISYNLLRAKVNAAIKDSFNQDEWESVSYTYNSCYSIGAVIGVIIGLVIGYLTNNNIRDILLVVIIISILSVSYTIYLNVNLYKLLKTEVK